MFPQQRLPQWPIFADPKRSIAIISVAKINGAFRGYPFQTHIRRLKTNSSLSNNGYWQIEN